MTGICNNCGEQILPVERVELGYTYCMKDECLKACQPRVNGIAVVMCHKQGFNLMLIEEALGKNFMDSHGRSD